MAKTGGQKRAAAQLVIRAAAAKKLSVSETIKQLKAKGLSYRRTTMLADWRNFSNIKKKEGLLKYVRKDRVPTAAIAQVRDWKLSREYLIKVKMQTRLKPTDHIVTRYVNIVSDKPMTPRDIETEIMKNWGSWYPEHRETIMTITPETIIQRM